ncbi:aminotransferase class I/II-fold pyridoxal phosphate-dependent enzyme [Serratia rubidaea]|uniref:Aminotransferase class I/II-fold pyridoxal phosphate-dependent enzyme n=1 Tax=Serratia rubidaea TaxID=61652 RepID=A0A448SUM1_SERRU|nr:aminotransferase class I/II-fold pyridoxal phosphate-dependent enzyme [Serratia rubidaea]MBH1931426.1 aminotransferase class I/II-fold pyridoxal phosphate-dependent enzyme [Serratia rubidaea]MDC6119505.1 aminotransferase class I/II-fold pyridoxal phosphate-dependent enzyme [Serratia rubidaea]MEB7584606.1 aminotransferase class I/II-fold pyridoxal phosphate-dependent enzyme [Serratia rubidaea]VEI71466.1 Putative phenylalanine aminotransferase [Serratia rubidaea]
MSLQLGINSYGSDFSGDDGEGLMLAWTSDEQSQLDIDLHGLLTATLATEVSKGATLLRRYAVDDPYGAGVMRPALRVLFNTDFQPEQIVCAAGVVGLLHGLANLTKGGLCHANDVYRDLPAWSRNRGFSVSSIPGIKDCLKQDWQMLLFENPPFFNSAEMTDDLLTEICTLAEKRGGFVVVDESNANYLAPDKSLIKKVNKIRNLVILRGFSKGYGLGSLRLGVAVCSHNIVAKIRSAIAPLAVSPLSLELGAAVWSKGDIMTRLRERIATEKDVMKQLMDRAGAGRRMDEHPQLPYLLLSADDTSIIRRTENAGIRGKFHFTAGIGQENRYYRLSVPLHPERAFRFCNLIAGCY